MAVIVIDQIRLIMPVIMRLPAMLGIIMAVPVIGWPIMIVGVAVLVQVTVIVGMGMGVLVLDPVMAVPVTVNMGVFVGMLVLVPVAVGSVVAAVHDPVTLSFERGGVKD